MTSEELAELERVDREAAVLRPWKWWTSNSWRRLGTPDRDGYVACPNVNRNDGHPDIAIDEGDMRLIEVAVNRFGDLIRAARERNELAADVRELAAAWARVGVDTYPQQDFDRVMRRVLARLEGGKKR